MDSPTIQERKQQLVRDAIWDAAMDLFAEKGFDETTVEDISEKVDWFRRLARVDVVIHLAARAHVTTERSREPLAAFRATNVDPTVALFEGAQRAGVRRFIFLSSIGVSGNATTTRPFRESDAPHPTPSFRTTVALAVAPYSGHPAREPF